MDAALPAPPSSEWAGWVRHGQWVNHLNGSNEGEIRKALVKDDVVDCIVALPPQLFLSTGIPVCLWFFDRDKASSGETRSPRGVLFIDARQMGEAISRKQIRLTDEEIAEIAALTTHGEANRRQVSTRIALGSAMPQL